MVMMSTLFRALRNVTNAQRRGKRQVLIYPCSRVIIRFLKVMQRHGYIGDFEVIDDHRALKIVVDLNGRLNKTCVISPRLKNHAVLSLSRRGIVLSVDYFLPFGFITIIF